MEPKTLLMQGDTVSRWLNTNTTQIENTWLFFVGITLYINLYTMNAQGSSFVETDFE